MAIEIENATTMKHLMGSMVNAGALGRVGVAIAWNPPKLKAFRRVREYLGFLSRVGKNSFNTANLLIVTHTQFEKAINLTIES